ncbi:MAG: tetratricopeptide repeat protein [Planctomycetota bacterium]|nr:tetratricopeptide repeat protein [Planctomycetota bacterium]MDA1211542.1 tetratricopeptide repeat protein [Planctomycetota bacterium]
MMNQTDQMYNEAMQLKFDDNLEGCVNKLEEILTIDPNHVLAHSALGVHLQKIGKPDEAIQHALKVAELEPNDPFSFTQLSVIYQRCGKIPEAEAAMEKARLMR